MAPAVGVILTLPMAAQAAAAVVSSSARIQHFLLRPVAVAVVALTLVAMAVVVAMRKPQSACRTAKI